MDSLDYAKTPTGRKFKTPGSLVGQPSLLERRQAVSDMAAINNRESSLARRLFRQYSQASRKGDTEAGEKALDLFDRSRERGIELGGIQSYDQRMNAAGQDLSQRMQVNQELTDMEGGPDGNSTTEDAFAGGPMTVTAQGWTPNETLATDPVQAQEGIVGGPSGIDAAPIRSGPSPAEGGIMAARRKASTPISSIRQPLGNQWEAPQSLDPNYGPPVGSVSTPGSEFDKKFPALSAFMKRAGEVKDYRLSDPGNMQDTGLGGVSNLITSDLEKEVANYRFDESLPEDEKKRRMAKRAKTERIDLSLAERSRRPARVITSGTTF